ncbi:MAG: hypothetical protein mread185_000652 [Mycoplasmataceae bacterium]|nr:MAG: hypothetical protein mread185_000652 [Mycoplasmataceae bacterium]
MITKQRQSNYKDKEDGGWFSKWAKKTEKRLIKADKSLTKSSQRKELIAKSKKAKSSLKKKSYSWGWNRWVDSENKRLDKIIEEQEKDIGHGDLGGDRENSDIWTIYKRAFDEKDKGQWFWGKYKVLNDYTGEMGIWDADFPRVLDFAKHHISGLVIDYDSESIWTKRLW